MGFLVKLFMSFIPGIGPIMTTIGTMISNAFNFVLLHWKFFAIASLVGILAYQNTVATRFLFGLETIPHLQTVIVTKDGQIAQLKSDLATAVTANLKLTNSISDLNLTVGQWKSISDQLQKKNKELEGQLVKMRKDTDKKVQDILNSKTPTSCEASIDFLRTEIPNLAW